MTYKSESKIAMGLRTHCPVCGTVLNNTPMFGRRVDKRSKITCPYCGRAIKERKTKLKETALKEALMQATENIEKLARDRVIPRP